MIVLTDKFGSGFSLVRSDIGGNIDRLAAAQAKDPTRYTTLFTVVTDEVQRGEQEGKHSVTNGLLWLKRCKPSRTSGISEAGQGLLWSCC